MGYPRGAPTPSHTASRRCFRPEALQVAARQCCRLTEADALWQWSPAPPWVRYSALYPTAPSTGSAVGLITATRHGPWCLSTALQPH